MDSLAILLKVISFSAILFLAFKLLILFLRMTLMPNLNIRVNDVVYWFRHHRDGSLQSESYLFLKVILLALVVQLITYYITYLGFLVINHQESRSFLDSFQSIWLRWDSDSYLMIAEKWYVTEGTDRFRLVFYPLYPILIKLTNYVVGDYFLSGIVVSLTCYSIACYLLFKLVQHEFGDNETAWNSVIYMIIFPFSFFYGTVYTESLFLMLTIGCFYFLAKQLWFVAGIFGLLAAFTRTQGILLFIPFVIEIIRRYPLIGPHSRVFLWDKRIVLPLVCSLLVLVGFGCYLLVNKQVTGDYFTYLDYMQQNWGQRMGFFADNIGEIFKRAVGQDKGRAIGIWGPTVVVFFMICGILLWGVNHVPLSWSAYALAAFIIAMSPTWLLSGPRYVTVIFPIYVMLAKYLHMKQWKHNIYVIVSSCFMMLYAILFTRSIVF